MSEKAPTSADVSVVVVTYNAEAFIGSCLEALGLQTTPPSETIVVDNASTDGTVGIVQGRFPGVRLLLNKANRGFSGGANDGVAIARGTWIAFLNPDARPEPRWLEALLEAARNARKGDLIRSLVLDDGVPLERYRLVETMNLCGRLVRVDGVEGDFAFAAAGAAMLFEKAEYPVPFPEGFFLYHEDLHMSWYARLKGHDVILSRASRAGHIGQASTKKNWSVSHFHGEKNRLTNFLVFWEARTRIRLLPVVSLDFLLHLPDSPQTRMKVVGWLLSNRGNYLAKRREIQSARIVPDRELLATMSAKLSPRSGRVNAAYNRIILAYCKAFGLLTRELNGRVD